MPERHLPVQPDLDRLKHQAKDLLRDMKRDRPDAKLADAQCALARSYGVASWPRLVLACHMVDAICRDDADAVRALVLKYPNLLHEMARGTDTRRLLSMPRASAGTRHSSAASSPHRGRVATNAWCGS